MRVERMSVNQRSGFSEITVDVNQTSVSYFRGEEGRRRRNRRGLVWKLRRTGSNPIQAHWHRQRSGGPSQISGALRLSPGDYLGSRLHPTRLPTPCLTPLFAHLTGSRACSSAAAIRRYLLKSFATADPFASVSIPNRDVHSAVAPTHLLSVAFAPSFVLSSNVRLSVAVTISQKLSRRSLNSVIRPATLTSFEILAAKAADNSRRVRHDPALRPIPSTIKRYLERLAIKARS